MLFVNDIHQVAKLKRNMKNSLMNLYDKILFRKKPVIEIVNDELKNTCLLKVSGTALSTTSHQIIL